MYVVQFLPSVWNPFCKALLSSYVREWCWYRTHYRYQFYSSCWRRLLWRPDIPPDHKRLHDSGRRSSWKRNRRFWNLKIYFQSVRITLKSNHNTLKGGRSSNELYSSQIWGIRWRLPRNNFHPEQASFCRPFHWCGKWTELLKAQCKCCYEKVYPVLPENLRIRERIIYTLLRKAAIIFDPLGLLVRQGESI